MPIKFNQTHRYLAKITIASIVMVFVTSINTIVFAQEGLTDDEEGLLSGKSGSFTVFSTTNKEQTKQEIKKTADTTKILDEFELYKQWHANKEANTEQYQVFLLWLKYQDQK